MIYHRPTIGSLNLWAEQVGDESYSFKNFLPYYEKSVHYTPPSIQYKNSSNVQSNEGFVASGGPLQVSFGKYEDPFGTWAQRAFQAIGQTAIKGFQTGKLIGSGYMAFTEDPTTAHRSSSESSFLQSTKSKQVRLTIYKNTLAEKILFRGSNNRALGVTVSPYSTKTTNSTKPPLYTLYARKEVILSAGAFQSPELLMVSGIGPPLHPQPLLNPHPPPSPRRRSKPARPSHLRYQSPRRRVHHLRLLLPHGRHRLQPQRNWPPNQP